jgi:hypothetical protein
MRTIKDEFVYWSKILSVSMESKAGPTPTTCTNFGVTNMIGMESYSLHKQSINLATKLFS